MIRDTIKFEFGGGTFLMNAVPTIHEDRKIEDIAASFISEGIDGLEKLKAMTVRKDALAFECAKRDDKNQIITADVVGMYLIDAEHPKFPIYMYFKNILDNAYFYGKCKILLVEQPEGFDIDSLPTTKYLEFRSAFEVALERFQAAAGKTEMCHL
jgi:hypothetical protein